MPFSPGYRNVEPSREELDQSNGLVLVEFGADWCGHCLALEAVLEEVLAQRADIQHLRIADGRGKPLGRSFRVKLWPTLVLMQDGSEIGMLVRPSPAEVRRMIAAASSIPSNVQDWAQTDSSE